MKFKVGDRVKTINPIYNSYYRDNEHTIQRIFHEGIVLNEHQVDLFQPKDLELISKGKDDWNLADNSYEFHSGKEVFGKGDIKTFISKVKGDIERRCAHYQEIRDWNKDIIGIIDKRAGRL